MNYLRILALALLLAVLCLGTALYAQHPRFTFSRDRVGLILLKGGYRSWYASFCDGFVPDQRGKLTPVSLVTTTNQGLVTITFRPGCRWPRFHHADMRNWTGKN